MHAAAYTLMHGLRSHALAGTELANGQFRHASLAAAQGRRAYDLYSAQVLRAPALFVRTPGHLRQSRGAVGLRTRLALTAVGPGNANGIRGRVPLPHWQNGEKTRCEALDVLFFGRYQRRNRLGHGTYDAQTTTRELFRLGLRGLVHTGEPT